MWKNVARTLFSPRDVAQIVGLQESRVRYWAQTGFVGPSDKMNGRAVYNFADLVSVKAAKELLDRGVSLQQARKNLEALRKQWPDVTRPLAELRVRSDGERVIVSGDDGAYEPLSGQLVMDFTVDELAGHLESLDGSLSNDERGDATTSVKAEGAWAWFREGNAHEADGDDDAALIAYEKALQSDPALAAAHTNLGNLLFRRGARGEAREHYETALRLDPEQPEARYNLGNLLDELGEAALARMEWYRVVTACPEFADAHFNLAVGFLRDGEHGRARTHLERFLALVPDDEQGRALMARL
jgi:tetratricopeptide (TPR) repeat protein